MNRLNLLPILLLILLMPAVQLQAQTPCSAGLGESADNPFLIPDTVTFYAFARCMSQNGVFYYDCARGTFTLTKPESDSVEITSGGANKYFKLTADLVLNYGSVAGCNGVNLGYGGVSWREWTPMTVFDGHFDGGYHTISGLFLLDGGDKCALFQEVSGTGCVENLGVTNAYISGNKYVGGIAGCVSENAVIQKCFFEGSLVAHDDRCGGIAAYTYGSALVTNCYASGSAYSTKDYVGGIVGWNKATVSFCYSSMFVSNATGGTIGGVYGNNEGVVTYCHYDTQMTDVLNYDASPNLTTEMTQSGFTDLGSAFVPQDGYYPYLAGFDFANNPAVRLSVLPVFFYADNTLYETAGALTHNFTVGTTEGAVWSETSWNNCATVDTTTHTVTLLKQGIDELTVTLGAYTRTYTIITNRAPLLGSEENPFTIDNLTDLKNFRDGINSGIDFTYKRWRIYTGNLVNTHWLQTADIVLPTGENWTPVGSTSDFPFTGYYHGGDNAIKNLQINGGNYKGLFGYVSNASISHLKIREIKIKRMGNNSGVLCGYMQNSIVEYCSLESRDVVTSNSSSNYGLGFIGTVENGTSIIRHCYNTCDFSGSTAEGGIVGRGIGNLRLTIEDCWNSGDITGVANNAKIGGIIGAVYKNLNSDTLTVYIKFCRNSGTINYARYNGGLVGNVGGGTKGEIAHCVNTGDVSSIKVSVHDTYVGGICGLHNEKNYPIKYCINTGDIISNVYMGGISTNQAIAYYCVNAGNVKVDYSNSYNSGWGNVAYGLAPSAYNSYNIASVEGIRSTRHPISGNSTTSIFYNNQFCIDATNQAGYGRTTSQMIGTNPVIKDALGEEFLFEEGMYPRPKWTDTIPWARELAIAACTPVILDSIDKDADNVTKKFRILGCDSSITWKVQEQETPGLGGRLFRDFAVGSTITGSCVDNAVTPVLNNVCTGPTVIGAYIHDTVLVKRVCLRHYVAPRKDTLCIDTEDDLIALRDSIHTGEAFFYRDTALVPRFADSTCFKLCNDITLDHDSDWIPIGSNYQSYFNGVLLGDGHTIRNLNCAGTIHFAGLFGWVKGRVQDLNMDSVNIRGGRWKGSVVAQLSGGRVTNCTASGILSGGDYYAGGIVGLCEGNAEVSYCTNYMTLKPTATNASSKYGRVGGIVGEGGTVSHCVNKGEITVSENFTAVGGVAGKSTVEDSYNMGKVMTTGNNINYLGGVAGTGTVRRSYNTGEISGVGGCAYIGGVLGNGTVNRCYNVGKVTALPGNPDADTYVGGVAGNGTVTYTYNSAIVNGANRKYVGGVIGAGTAKYCYNSNTVSGMGTYVGSVSGQKNNNTAQCVYDKQLSIVGGMAGADVNSKATGFLTEAMLQNGLSGKISPNVAGDTVWLFSENDTLLYPQLRCLAHTDPSISSVMPVSLDTSSSDYDVWKKVTGSSFLMHGCELGDWEILQGNSVATLDNTPAICSGTITSIGILKLGASVNGEVYRQVRLLVGLDNPLRIKNVTELKNFRDVINSDLGYFDLQNEVFKTSLNHEDSLRIDFFLEIKDGGLDLSFKLIPDSATAAAGCYDLSSISNWQPIGDYSSDISWMFRGTFLGDGQIIKGLKITSDSNRRGLFGRTSGAELRDLTLTDAKVEGSGKIRGALVGEASEGSLIDNCVLNNDTLAGTGNYAGGMCGFLNTYSTLKNCSADYCVVTSTGEQTGGLVGRMEYSKVDSCLNDHLSMSGSGNYKGGVVGLSQQSNIYNSTLQNSNINVSGDNLGGIVGRVVLAISSGLWNKVKNCANINNNIYVNANYVGGIAGYQQGSGDYARIQACHSTGGSIISTKDYVGGIVGFLTDADGTSDHYNNTPIQAQNYAGGIVGGCRYGNEITKSYNFANITATGSYAGGIIGSQLRQDSGPSVTYCYNAGEILATSCSGGICGAIMVSQVSNRGISHCFNVGNVTAKDARAGGIVGFSELSNGYRLGGHVRYSFNAGIVTAVTQAGGILGCSGVPIDNTDVNFTNNVNVGWVEAASLAGAICGYTPQTSLLTNNYYDLQMSRCKGVSDADVPGTTGKLTTEMLGDSLRASLQDTYWTYAEGMYPRIKYWAATDAAIAAAMPVLLPVASDTICASDVPKGDYNNALAGCDSVLSWVRTDGYGLSIAGCDFTVTGRNYVLIADRTNGDTLKEVQLALGISEKNPLDIVNLEQLKRLRDYVNSNVTFYYNPDAKTFVSDDATSGEHYIKIEPGGARMFFRLNFEDGSQTVDLSMESGDWTPIGAYSSSEPEKKFKGHFNGNNHTVKGMGITNGTKDYQGFFGYLQGTVKNLYMSEVNLTCAGNCHGAIAGYNVGTFVHCAVLSGQVKGDLYTGGLSGVNRFTQMSDCYNGADVTGRQYVGGIAGRSEEQGFITRCFNYGMVTSTVSLNGESYAGGITGYTTEDVTYCYNTGTVNGQRRMAGVVGWSQTRNLNYCYNAGYVNSTAKATTNIYVGSVAASDNAVYYPNYSYYDHQMSPNFRGIGLTGGSTNSSDRVAELLTVTMTGETSSMRGVMDTTYWTYAEGEYPRLRSLADEPGSTVSVKAVRLPENMLIDHIGMPFTASLGDSVVWQRHGNSRVLNMMQASDGKFGLTICGPDTLSVALAQTCRLVPLYVTELSAATLVDTACNGFYLWQATGRVYTRSIKESILMPVAEGCDSVMRLDLTIPPELNIDVDVHHRACYGDTDEYAEATVSGGFGQGYLYCWTNAGGDTISQTNRIENCGPGDFILSVRDAVHPDCEKSVPVTITEPQPLELTLVEADNRCYGENDGIIVVSYSGGLPDYTLSYTGTASATKTVSLPSASDTLRKDFGNGTYTVTVTDRNSCSVSLAPIVFADSTDEYNIMPVGVSKMYNGVAVNVARYELTIGGGSPVLVNSGADYQLPNGDTLNVTVEQTGMVKDVVDTTNSIVTYSIRNKEDKTCRYHITGPGTTVPVIITPRNVTFKSADSVVTCGSGTENPDCSVVELTNHRLIVGGDGFVTGEGVTPTFTGVQHGTGMSPNDYDYTWNSGTNPSNYNVLSRDTGILAVTSNVVIITNTDSKLYDGTYLMNPGYKVYGLASEDTLLVDLTTPYLLDAGTVPNDFTNERFVLKSDMTTPSPRTYIIHERVKGTMSVSRRNVTIRTGDFTHVYDGNTYSNPEVTVSGDGFATGEEPTIIAPKTITNVSTEENSYVIVTPLPYNPANYNITPAPGTLEITARPLNIVGGSDTVPYNGSEQSVTTYTASVLSGHTVSGVNYEAKGTVPGTYNGVFSNAVGDVVVKDAGDNNVTANYAITQSPGTLTIEPNSLPIVIISESYDDFKYNGQPHSYTHYKVTYNGTLVTNVVNDTVFVLPTADTLTIHPVDEGRGVIDVKRDASDNVVSYPNKYDYDLDNTGFYTNIDAQFGTLTVNPRLLTLVSPGYHVVYTGSEVPTALERSMDNVERTGEGLVPGESVSCTMKSTSWRIDVGSTPNDFDFVAGAYTNLDNYDVQKILGNIIVMPAQLTVAAEDKSKNYGQANPELTYTVTGFAPGEGLAGSGASNILHFENGVEPTLNTTATQYSNAGNYPITVDITGVRVVNASGVCNYELVANDATLHVLRRAIEITAKSKTDITYDGTEHSYRETGWPYYTVTGDFVAGDTVTKVHLDGSRVVAGTTTIIPSGAEVKHYVVVAPGDTNWTDVTANYEITYNNGALTIAPVDITITPKSYTHDFTGDTYSWENTESPHYEITSGALVAHDSIVLIGLSGSGVAVGTYDITIVPGSILIVDTNEVHGDYNNVDSRYDMTGGYNITLGTGTLQISGMAKVYDTLIVTVDSVSDPLCPGVNEGVARLIATGGNSASPRYSYQVVGNVTHDTYTGTSDSIIILSSLRPDTYKVTVTETLGKTDTASFQIKEREMLTTSNSTLIITTVIDDTIRHGGCELKIMDIGTPTFNTTTSLPLSEITISNNAPADSIYPAGETVVRWVAKGLCGDSIFYDQIIKVSFKDCPVAKDFEDTLYPSVRIGSGCKCWTTKDLKSTKYSDGRPIDNVMSYFSREFPNTEENVRIFGHLYDWYSSVDTGRYGSVDSIGRAYNLGHHIQGICPAGWYLPTDEEFDELNIYPTTDLRSTDHWITTAGVVNTNATGFNSLPGGRYNCPDDRYEEMTGRAYYWTCHPVYDLVTGAMIDYICEKIVLFKNTNCDGHSVRCIFDEH